jgi:uncharacterized membrane protein
MRIPTLMATAALIVAACAPRQAPEANLTASEQPGSSAAPRSAGWDLQSSGEGVALVYNSGAGTAAIRLLCPAGENRFLVNVPAFRPIGSEERLSFGSGGTVVALVADPRGDVVRGGVSGTGPVPDDLKGLVGGPINASYGAQRSGPHPTPPIDISRPFVTACFDHVAAALQAASRPNASTSPCLVQDGELLRMTPLRAIGTEPFWGARIEGRCVTYSHPEDQQGTRVWTRFNSGPQGGIWIGALGGKPFELRTRPQPGCSDGMSDNRYPIAVTLLVNGERRTGCAEPLKKPVLTKGSGRR